MRGHWLKAIGHARGPLAETWFEEHPELLRRTGFPRWPWTITVEPLLVVPVLDAAPPVEVIGVAARSMSRQSHIRIRPEHYERAVQALASIAW
jgi:hypothetical protein